MGRHGVKSLLQIDSHGMVWKDMGNGAGRQAKSTTFRSGWKMDERQMLR